MPDRPQRRRALRWCLFGLAGLAATYLVGVNILLNIGLGRALVNQRPGSARLAWSSAWTLWPGHLAVRGFSIEGRMRSRAWSVAIDRAGARWGVLALLRRELRFAGLHAEGVRTTVRRVPYTPPPGTKPTGGPAGPAPPSMPLRTWRFTFDGVVADDLRQIEIFGLIVDCAEGRASGSFGYQIAGKFRIEDGRADCSGARLTAGGRSLVHGGRIEAEAALAPYSPREHPGLAGFDFLDGRLQARGMADASALAARLSEPVPSNAPASPGETLVMDLRVSGGALDPGSFLRLDAGRDAPSLALEVTAEPAVTAVRLDAPALEIAGAGSESPPLLSSGPASFNGSTPERRLSRLFAATRAWRRNAQAVDIGLRGLLEMSLPRLDVDGAQARVEVEAARLSGTFDVAGLFARQVIFERLQIEGAALRVLPKENAPVEPGLGTWSVGLLQARFTGLREITVGDQRFVGPADAELTGGFSPEEGVEIEQLDLKAPRLDVYVGDQAASRGARLEAELRLAPLAPGGTNRQEVLRHATGRVRFGGRVASLGWLQRYLRRLSILQIDGGGDVVADVAVRDGRLIDGSEIRLDKGRLRANIFDTLAQGDATLLATVTGTTGASRVGIDVTFPRYALSSADGERAYVRGSGLKVRLSSGDLDLADLVQDLTARVEAKSAEIPDLRAYNSYLPPGAGVEILSGRGLFDLALDLDHAANTARGGIAIRSSEVALGVLDVTLLGRLDLASKLASADLSGRRFDLAGTRLQLTDVSLVETGEEAGPGESGWWATLDLAEGEVELRRPLDLEARLDLRMRDSGLLLSLASRRSRFLSWFGGVLDEEDVLATGQLRIKDGAIRIDPLRAEGGKVDLRARMHLDKGSRRIDVFLRHGHLAAGLELRNGKRDIKLIRPEAWYENRDGFD